MKLASLQNQTRDGELIIVNRSLTKAVTVRNIATTLQQALDSWAFCCSELEQIYSKLNENQISDSFDFNEEKCLSPLPRAYQWLDGSAYVNHVELVRKARGAEMPPSFWTDPLMYQGGSDCFLSPYENIRVADESWGIDFEAEIAVITDDVAMGVTEQDASQHIRLLCLVNDVSLRNLIPAELSKGFGFLQSKPSSAFSPVAVTPDELNHHWNGRKIALPLRSYMNGEKFGEPLAGEDMTFDFPQLIAHGAKSRDLAAGTIIGSGTVSNYDRSRGSSCLAEKRMLEMIAEDEAKTPFMKFGDRIEISMLDEQGQSIFGSINQVVSRS